MKTATERAIERTKRIMLEMYQDRKIEEVGELFCIIRDFIQTTSYDLHEKAMLEHFNIDLYRAKTGKDF